MMMKQKETLQTTHDVRTNNDYSVYEYYEHQWKTSAPKNPIQWLKAVCFWIIAEFKSVLLAFRHQSKQLNASYVHTFHLVHILFFFYWHLPHLHIKCLESGPSNLIYCVVVVTLSSCFPCILCHPNGFNFQLNEQHT